MKSNQAANLEAPAQESLRVFPKQIELDDDEDRLFDTEISKATKYLPFDWSIKSRVRILSNTIVVNNQVLPTDEAAGLTGFVRCHNTKPNNANISNGEKIQQNLLYWQYPYLPWLNLIQRNSSSNNQFKMNELESKSLLQDFAASYRNLFQLLRNLQCPFFYVIANQFTVLFRSVGMCGRNEIHALVTPTTRGFRQLLRQEEIEFTQPLKKNNNSEATPNTSLETSLLKEAVEDDEEDEMKFLESLGVNCSDIKFKDDIKTKLKEVEDDNGDMSTVLIEGADCQAFFNFLLDFKSIVPRIGRLAGVPPTLLSPVAFIGSSLRKQITHASKQRHEGQDFYSVELSGAILPHTVHSLCEFLSDIKDKYSLVMKNYQHTVAFTKTSRQLLVDNEASTEIATKLIGCQNLSDCGIKSSILERMLETDSECVNIVEKLQFEQGNGFTLL